MVSLLDVTTRFISEQQKVDRALDRKVDGAYRYLAGAIRRNARKSIRKGTKNKPHSLPDNPVNSRSRIFRNTIERDYNPKTKTLVVGPKTTRGRRNGGKTIPQGLEYGVTFNSPKPTFIPAAKADIRARTIAWKKKNQRRRSKGLKRIKKSELKWVIIPAGSRTIDPRPTMRLAFNKTLTATNLQRAFRQIGITDTSTLRRNI